MVFDFENEIRNILSTHTDKAQIDQLVRDVNPSGFTKILAAINNKEPVQLKNALEDYAKYQCEFEEHKKQHEKLGHLARQFQQSLISLRDGLGPRIRAEESTSGEAQSQIESVMNMTKEAAMAVLELGSKQSNSCQLLITRTNEIKTALIDQITDPVMRQKFDELTVEMERVHSEMDVYNQKLLISQSYQDLSGQILLRIKTFVDSIERGLVEIVKLLASDRIEDSLTQIDKEKILNNCNQNDVDDLLQSLGF